MDGMKLATMKVIEEITDGIMKDEVEAILVVGVRDEDAIVWISGETCPDGLRDLLANIGTDIEAGWLEPS